MGKLSEALQAAKDLESTLTNSDTNGGSISPAKPEDKKPNGENTGKVDAKLDGEKPKDSVSKDADGGDVVEESAKKDTKKEDGKMEKSTEDSFSQLASKSLDLLSKANEKITDLTSKSFELNAQLEKSVSKCDDMKKELDEEKKAHAELKKSYDELVSNNKTSKSVKEETDKDVEKSVDDDKEDADKKPEKDGEADKEKEDKTSKSVSENKEPETPKVDNPDKTVEKSLLGAAQNGDSEEEKDDDEDKDEDKVNKSVTPSKEDIYKSFVNDVYDAYDYVTKSALYGPNSRQADELAELERRLDKTSEVTPELKSQFDNISI